MDSQKEIDRDFINLLKDWQRSEGRAIDISAEMINKTDNAFLQAIMKIFRRDSHNHRIVLQLIVNHFEKEPIKLNPS